jgi:hypothetical protein
MELEQKLRVVFDCLGSPLTDEEEKIARRMLESPLRQYGSDNAPVYVAMYLEMLRKAS